VERHGGYSALLTHHRSYLSGPKLWLPHLSHQLAQASVLSGGAIWRLLVWTAAVLAAWSVGGLRLASSGTGPRRWFPVLAVIAACAGIAMCASLPWWLACAWIPWLALDLRPERRIIAAWWIVLTVMTPFYHPYARLWLPLEAASWVVIGGMLTARPLVPTIKGPRIRALGWTFAATCLSTAPLVEYRTGARPLPAAWFFDPTDGERALAYSLVTGEPGAAAPRSIHVYSRRSLAFYLTLVAKQPVVLEAGVDTMLNRPGAGDVYVVDGAMLRQAANPGAVQARLAAAAMQGNWHWSLAAGERLDPVTLLDVDPSDVYARVHDPVIRFWQGSAPHAAPSTGARP
jgi:hypothetical protein